MKTNLVWVILIFLCTPYGIWAVFESTPTSKSCTISKTYSAIKVTKEYFRCNQCDKSFKNDQELAMHENEHLGCKIYWCDLCSEQFLDAKAYEEHYISLHRT